MPPDPKVHVGVAAIVHKPGDDSQVLMIRRVGNTGYAADGHDTWSVPGGWLEHGEFLAEAVEREVAEETGVRVRARGQIGFVLCPSEVRDVSIATLFIKCEFVMGAPTCTEPDKCADVGWMPWSTVQDGRPLFAPLEAWLSLNPLGRKVLPLATCEEGHDEPTKHNSGFESVELAHRDAVEQRSGDDRRAAWDHPDHYGGKDNPHETIKCIRAHNLDFELGNAVKYIFRAGKKDKTKHIEDLRKAIQYIEFEIELVQDNAPDAVTVRSIKFTGHCDWAVNNLPQGVTEWTVSPSYDLQHLWQFPKDGIDFDAHCLKRGCATKFGVYFQPQ